jgi:predicted DNA-binding protein
MRLVNVLVRLPVGLHRKLRRLAKRDGRSMAAVVRHLILAAAKEG